MKLKDFFNSLVEFGILSDPRGLDCVNKQLEIKKKKYDDLSNEKKSNFDLESLKNPYKDTRILNGSGDEEIKSILIGIDIDVSELLLADYLKKSGKQIDLVMSHHPSGYAYANLYEVMGMQKDILEQFGVPINVAEGLLSKRIKEVSRKLMPANHTRVVDAAKLMNIPFICAHTVADNHVAKYLQDKFDSSKAYVVSDVVKTLESIPEYKNSIRESIGPKIIVGSEDNRAGKVFVDMTGGTEGAVEFLEKLSVAGVGTIVGMHMSEDHIKNAEKSNINVVIAGHISSDTLGLNLLLDKVEGKFGHIDIIPCSGFSRINRK
ncbi:MAG: NGG1p interacting factor NIF3 [Elusimicrobia bacterium RIFOXYD2_FULL_34_15]|nr:MAG: NGG1p interacting factor NIF3 [Elusimicrobia bacterium RIFOXYD2_FULL_34_15]